MVSEIKDISISNKFQEGAEIQKILSFSMAIKDQSLVHRALPYLKIASIPENSRSPNSYWVAMCDNVEKVGNCQFEIDF